MLGPPLHIAIVLYCEEGLHLRLVGAHVQVSALESVFEELRADVEALFMAVPPSDPEQLAVQARDMHLQAEEQVTALPQLYTSECCTLLCWRRSLSRFANAAPLLQSLVSAAAICSAAPMSQPVGP